ncbi:MAG: molybdopterin molybdotransferase MoeA [Desulfobacterales bacterium]|nr:MAG: molybdopterin molybdotransferase MoeA [Desulfobacterales bacterium]
MKTFISFKEAFDLTLSNVPVGQTEILPLDQLTAKILSEDIVSKVDCPSISTSQKDGYAVVSTDLTKASTKNPVKLKLVGHIVAGDFSKLAIGGGQTVRVTTGAPLPDGADAVITEEFCRKSGNFILTHNTAESGRNLLEKGTDVRQGETVAKKGEKLSPPLIGLLASAGLDRAPVYKSPEIAVIATGDEVIAPGKPLAKGKLYASNMVELCAWLSYFGLRYTASLIADRKTDIQSAIAGQLSTADAFLTSGGAWGSERDLILKAAESLNWHAIYHRVRMGPGKPVGFGLLEKKPFFVLPGGPPSNEMAFLQLALPALLKMKGEQTLTFPRVQARLSETVHGRKDWTDFVHARLEKRNDQLFVHPAKLKSRLQSMARKEALIIIPEDREELAAASLIEIQLLNPSLQIP